MEIGTAAKPISAAKSPPLPHSKSTPTCVALICSASLYAASPGQMGGKVDGAHVNCGPRLELMYTLRFVRPALGALKKRRSADTPMGDDTRVRPETTPVQFAAYEQRKERAKR